MISRMLIQILLLGTESLYDLSPAEEPSAEGSYLAGLQILYDGHDSEVE
jgi:hypothetical protein